ncbi:uncharacterized protein CANTADRAFT_302203 [Suhomyces tanzawaensis NRRL Y-17324]|uniref:Uncharacterized protein n=1 Tax=Suhomyces tanzawaensis NRRL Y-17324 TaxID=984487 RepID=A0A1E4SCI2_9ASCO|nr:uncharacterized protein CANTADRAFT_302203 [Suhomyces tanzawaensis NRRL Y-17324]ODV77230.1 hypothetical protein CANTADRAFT_302203 [Suhomyces tanzawaensis NRRL Y-17324]
MAEEPWQTLLFHYIRVLLCVVHENSTLLFWYCTSCPMRRLNSASDRPTDRFYGAEPVWGFVGYPLLEIGLLVGVVGVDGSCGLVPVDLRVGAINGVARELHIRHPDCVHGTNVCPRRQRVGSRVPIAWSVALLQPSQGH